jgi:type I restriction enzyme M protein
MSKRHGSHVGGWEGIFQRLQELVMANSGEDEFEEVFKLVIVKLHDELFPVSTNRLRVTKHSSDNARRFNEMLARAEKRWPAIINGRKATELTDEHLTVCLRELLPHSLCDASLEVLDGAFEYLISHNAKGSKGQYFTPRHVVECCVRMLDPKPGETILDPACGSGGFLVHSYLHAQKRGKKNDLLRKNIWGFDLDKRAIQVARALMLIASGSDENISQLNTLRLPAGKGTWNEAELDDSEDDAPNLPLEDVVRIRTKGFRGFDVILTNPPFAGEVRERSFLNSYELARAGRRVERDVLFLERCVRLLKPGGRIAIVMPHNKFGASSWSYVRDWLVSKLRVVAVVGLGRHTFLPHTHQKASVLIGIKRSRPLEHPEDERILFMISEKDGKDSKGKQVMRTNAPAVSSGMWARVDHDLDEVAEEFDRFRAREVPNWSDSC